MRPIEDGIDPEMRSPLSVMLRILPHWSHVTPCQSQPEELDMGSRSDEHVHPDLTFEATLKAAATSHNEATPKLKTFSVTWKYIFR